MGLTAAEEPQRLDAWDSRIASSKGTGLQKPAIQVRVLGAPLDEPLAAGIKALHRAAVFLGGRPERRVYRPVLAVSG